MEWRGVTTFINESGSSILSAHSLRGWVLQVVPLGLLISLLVSTGSYVQDHLFKALTSDAPSIYAAVYSKGFVRFPSFAEWLSIAAYPQFLAIGLLTAYVALLRRRLWPVLAATAIWTALLLTLLDLWNTTFGQAKLADLPESLIGNALGGVAVAVVVGFALPLFQRIPSAFPESEEIAAWAAAAGTVLIGLGLSYALWYALYFFFQPVPVDFALVLDPPVGAFVGASHKSQLLNFLPDDEVNADIELQSTEAQPLVRWRASPKHSAYALTAHLLAACFDPDLTKFKPGVPFKTWQNVRSASLHFDRGFTTFKAHGEQASRFWFDRQLPSKVWVKKVGKDDLEVTHFVTEEEALSSSSAGALRLLLSAELVKFDQGRGSVSPRRLTLTVNGEDTVVDFRHADLPAKPTQCAPVEATQRGDILIPTPYSGVTVLLTLSPASSERDSYDVDASKFTITGASGWEQVSPIGERDLVGSASGSTDAVLVTGRPLLVEVDGQRQQATEFDSLLIYGKVEGSVLDGRRIRFDGTANMLWRDQVRANPTRWERWPSALQMALLPAFAAVLGFLLRVIWWPAVRDLRNEDVNDWL